MNTKDAQIEYVGELVGNIVKEYVRLHPQVLPEVLPRSEEDQQELDSLRLTVRELEKQQEQIKRESEAKQEQLIRESEQRQAQLKREITHWQERAMMRFEQEARLLEELRNLPDFSVTSFEDILESDDFSVFIGNLYDADMPERIYEQMKYVLKVAEPDEGQQIIGVLKRLLQCCLNLRNKVLVRRQYQLWEPEIGTKYDPESMFASGKVIQGKVESVLLPGILMVKDDDSTSVVKPCNVILNR